MKVPASIVLSCVIGYLVYSFYRSIVHGLNPYMYIVFLLIILVVTTADIFLIISQKAKSRKIIMVTLLALSILSAMVISRVYLPKGTNNDIPGQSAAP